MKNLLFTTLLALLFFNANAYAIEKDELFIFVGNKISIEKVENNQYEAENGDIITPMDGKYHSMYNVNKVYNGSNNINEVEFIAYDHYGTPKFSNHKNVLLFIVREGDQNIHVKYQFFDVYKTKDDRWAYCGKSYGYEDEFEEEYPVKLHAQKIDFEESIFHDISEYKQDLKDYPEDKKYIEEEIEYFYPKKYFDTSGDQAICRGMGIYAEDLAKAHTKYILKHWD